MNDTTASSSRATNPRIRPLDFRIGKADNTGAIVERIYSQQVDFVVYRSDHSIKIDIDEQSSRRGDLAVQHNKIAVPLGKIYSWLPEKLSWSEAINKQIARSIAMNALGDCNGAVELLNHVILRIPNLKTMHGRLQYTLSSLLVVGAVLAIAVLLSAINFHWPNQLWAMYYRFAKIAFCGALGGLLSVSLGFPRLQIDIDGNKLTNCLTGASRVFISMSAAFFAYFAIEAGIAFSVFKGIDSKSYGLYVMAMVAGFSEMLIPNLMMNLSGNAERDSNSTATSGRAQLVFSGGNGTLPATNTESGLQQNGEADSTQTAALQMQAHA